ncbi:MAG: hybrid sensor histidine kinase/response regulator [Thalassobaculum sp.]|uniref:hybrid sensor histidine kinase/response regulator n=1 Tax=Thalassobaculum sp. TaxID=2022740 RepID=UPI0032EC4DF3
MSEWSVASAGSRGAGPPLTAARNRWRKSESDEAIRVMIVDDDAEDRLTIRRYLRGARSCRFAVRECDDPADLVAILDDSPVDVILMDQRLGGQQGTDVIRRIGGSRAAAPAILLTGYDEAAVEEEAIVAGAAEHLNKADLSSRVLERTIKYVVKWHSDQLELRRQGEQLQLAWSEAAKANRAKSVFLASMSHELRTPLNAIIGFSTMLLGKPMARKPTRVREYASFILDGGQQLLHLVDNLLDIARIEAGQFVLGDEILDLGEALLEVARQNEPLARQRGIEVVVQCPANLPLIRIDRTGFQQIFLNLLSNGTKYTHAGGRVTVTVSSLAATLRVTVRDTGIGMAEDEVETALRPFMRIRNNAYVRSTEGTGLGLAIVTALAGQLDLTVEFDSRPGDGTTVTVTIPADRVERGTAPQSP